MHCKHKFVYHVIVLILSWFLFSSWILFPSSSFVTYIFPSAKLYDFRSAAMQQTAHFIDRNSINISSFISIFFAKFIRRMAACEKQISHRCSKNHWSYSIIIIIYATVFVHCNFDRCRSAVYCFDQVFFINTVHSWEYWMCWMPNTKQRLEQKCYSEWEANVGKSKARDRLAVSNRF